MKRLFQRTNKLIFQQKRPFCELSKFNNNFLSVNNLAYIQSMYEKWLNDKTSVSSSLNAFFELLQKGQDPEKAFNPPPKEGQKLQISTGSYEVWKQLGVRMMIDRYRAVAHQFAKTDPLQLDYSSKMPGKLEDSCLNIEEFGFTKQNLKDEIILKYLRQENSDKINGPYTIKDMEDYLRKIYTGKVGYEYMHLNSKEQRDFLKASIQKYIEHLIIAEPTKEERFETFRRLCKDQTFIDFLLLKFTNIKRFGIEGLNAVTSALGKLVQVASETGCQHIVMGMAHRGRLNALHCVLQKPAEQIFRQFFQKDESEHNAMLSGDVKYHLGYRTRKNYKGNQIHLRLLPNPSHLQAVDSLVYGCVRAIEEQIKDSTRTKAMGVLLHGDTALTGQGSIYEALQFQDLVDYKVGGIIHIVMNNQVGFTASPWLVRSSFYCTQIAKTIGSPVIHVNADQPDLLDGAMQVAVAYRQKFNRDIFIEIVGYRRFGHTQQDEPAFTQPKMAQKAKNHPTVFQIYSKRCIQNGVLTQQQIEDMKKQLTKQYEKAFKNVMNDKHENKPEHEDPYYDLETVKNPQYKTGATKETLVEVFMKLISWPQNFNIHPTIKKIMDERIRTVKENDHLDWATMQSLAFATLLNEGYGIRLSGQDVERGTFSHRHAYISDQHRDVEKLNFYKNLSKDKATICNSHLSEYGVCGYEYGYSITNPNALVIWQAQFGDFANGAQIPIDNYISYGECKWGIQTGIVLNLPHGMDGQGPEHSSGRIQRFLLMSDDNTDVDLNITYQEQLRNCNIQVVSCSNTSNYFHVLRRQLRRDYRKPLINFNSKKLLKFKGANRPMQDILEGTEFKPVIADTDVKDHNKVKRVIICNGQFYYELRAKRDELKREDIAIVRIEQIAPFPHEHLKEALAPYLNKDVGFEWAQEEHENYGAWNFVYPRLRKLLNKPIKYFGRKPSAATAAGALKLHRIEDAQLMERIFPQLKKSTPYKNKHQQN